MQMLADTIGTLFLSGVPTSHFVAAGQEGGDVPKKGLFSLPFMERAMQRRKQQAHSEALELLKASGAFNLNSRVMHEPAGQGPQRGLGVCCSWCLQLKWQEQACRPRADGQTQGCIHSVGCLLP